MREKKYTKGSWTIFEVMSHDGMKVVGDNDIAWEHSSRTISAHVDTRIAEVMTNISKQEMGGYPTVPTVEEMIANAHLIAAAPELLEALEGMEGLYAEYMALRPPVDKTLDGCMDQMSLARKAVAKAYGE